MSTTIPSANMSLPIPVAGTQSGPNWALNLDACLQLIDTHDHSTGKGVAITPAGLNITSDLTFQGNNATQLRSARFTAQTAPLGLASDLDCLYTSGVDLYYNDGNGNQIQITQGGGIAGSPGSISNLTSPASASYVAISEKFVWQSDSNKAASMDMRSAVLRNSTVSSFGLTLSPPTLSADYTITLPTLPGSGSRFLSIDNTGLIGSTWNVDNSTLEINTNLLIVKTGGITATQIASNAVTTVKILNNAVTPAKLSAFNYQASSSIDTSTTSITPDVVAGSVLTPIVTNGRPVMIGLFPSTNNPDEGYVSVTSSANTDTVSGFVVIRRDGVGLYSFPFEYVIGANNAGTKSFRIPASCVNMIDFVSAGTYTYSLSFYVTVNTTTIAIKTCIYRVWEI